MSPQQTIAAIATLMRRPLQLHRLSREQPRRNLTPQLPGKRELAPGRPRQRCTGLPRQSGSGAVRPDDVELTVEQEHRTRRVLGHEAEQGISGAAFRCGCGRSGRGWDGHGWDGHGWNGHGWNGHGWNGRGWNGNSGGEGSRRRIHLGALCKELGCAPTGGLTPTIVACFGRRPLILWPILWPILWQASACGTAVPRCDMTKADRMRYAAKSQYP